MKNKVILMTVALLFSISGHTTPTLESLYGDFYNQSGVSIQVFSGGCTSKDSFAVQKQNSRGVALIYFYRIKPDLCKAFFRYGMILNFTYEDLGLQYRDRFKIMNPYVAPRAKAEVPLEAVYGHYNNNHGVFIQVRSGGCTSKSSFAMRKQNNQGVQQIYLYRIEPDFCETFLKYGKLLSFSHADLGLQLNDRFQIMNPRIEPRTAW